MALKRSDLAGISSSGDALAQLIMGNIHKKEQATQAGKIDAANKAAELEQQAALGQEAIDANLGRAQAQADAMGIPKGKFAIGANATGFNVNPEPAKDPLEMFLKAEAMRASREARDDKDVQVLSKRVEGAQLGPSQAALQNLGTSVKQKGVALGPISGSSSMPAALVSIGEQLGLAAPGATEQRQSVEALQAFQRNPLFGASLTPGEQQNFNNAFGLLTAGSEEQRIHAMKTLEALYNKATANVAAGSPQRIRDKYAAQGGISLQPSNVFGAEQPAQGGMDQAKKSRLEELRARHRGGR